MAPYFTIPGSAQPKLKIRCTLMYNVPDPYFSLVL